MNEFPNPQDEAAPSILDRIEGMEPYVAIRLMILQLGVAAAVGLTASRNLEGLSSSIEGLPDPGTLFSLSELARFGYPIRELIWGGDWWRVPIGLFLPPQWMLWAIACVGMFPFAKYLEARIGRPRSLFVYFMGALCTVYIDLLSYGGVTTGALGMVMAAGGAAWVLLRFDGFRIVTSTLEIPGVAWFLLFLLAPIAWVHSNLHFALDPVTASVTPLVPSWIGLLAAGITGMMCVLPIGLEKVRAEAESLRIEPGLWRPNLGKFVACFWGFTVTCYGLLSWIADYRIDHRLWKLEPGIQSGNPNALVELDRLAEANPSTPFLDKRLAIHYLRSEDWSMGDKVLNSLIDSASPSMEPILELKWRGRLANLNLRDDNDRLSWRFSGISNNYSFDRPRILLDLAHSARLQGATDRLNQFREAALLAATETMNQRIQEIADTVQENEDLRDKEPTAQEEYRRNRLEAQILNAEAYLMADLAGDLDTAYEKAKEAVGRLGDPMLSDTLGWIEILRGNPEEGVRLIEDSLFAPGFPPSGTVHYHLAVGLEQLGQLSRARKVYEKALSLDLEWWEELDIRHRCAPCFAIDPSRL